jgi:hypothetical protein
MRPAVYERARRRPGIIRSVPVAPDPSRPGWHVLVEPGGAPIAHFVHAEREGRVIADLLELLPSVSVERAVPTILDDLRGRRVAGDETVGCALVAAGGRPARHAHVLTRDLAREPASEARPAPDGLTLGPLDRPAADLVRAYRSAYSAEHPDGVARTGEDPEVELTRILEHGVLGPLMDCSGVALDRRGRVAAAVVITDTPGDPPFGGPWVTECFRHRDAAYAGAGRALLERTLVLATRARVPALGLAVTHGNRAEQLYAALGFRHVFTAFSVDL